MDLMHIGMPFTVLSLGIAPVRVRVILKGQSPVRRLDFPHIRIFGNPENGIIVSSLHRAALPIASREFVISRPNQPLSDHADTIFPCEDFANQFALRAAGLK